MRPQTYFCSLLIVPLSFLYYIGKVLTHMYIYIKLSSLGNIIGIDLIGSLEVLLSDELYFPSRLSSTYGFFQNKEGEQQKAKCCGCHTYLLFHNKVPFDPCTFSHNILLRKHERKAYKTKSRNKRKRKWRLKPKISYKNKIDPKTRWGLVKKVGAMKEKLNMNTPTPNLIR